MLLRTFLLQAGRVTLQALALSAILGSGVAVALVSGAEPALSLMGADAGGAGALHDLSRDYLVLRYEGFGAAHRRGACSVPLATRPGDAGCCSAVKLQLMLAPSLVMFRKP